MKNTATQTIHSLAQKLGKNQDGVAAIEFALMAPLLIALYFGLAEVTKAITVDRSLSHATSVVGDLATQTSNITRTDLEDILSASLKIVNDASSSKVTISLESYGAASGNRNAGNVLLGSAVMNPGAAQLPAFNADSVNPTLLNTTSGIIVSRMAYNYSPLKLRFMKSDITLKETFVLKPRRSSVTLFDNQVNKRFTCQSSGDNVGCS